MSRVLVGLALSSTIAAATLGWKLFTITWRPRAPFDVLGVLWLLSNLPYVVGWIFLFGIVALALYSWFLVLRHRGSGRNRSA